MRVCVRVCAEALKKVKNFDRRKQETGSPSCSQCRRQQRGGEKWWCGVVGCWRVVQGGRSKIFLCVEIFQLDQIAYIINIYIDTYKISACVGAGNFNNHYQQNDNVVAAPSPHTLRHHVAETDNARTRLRTSGGWSGWVWRRRRRSTQHTTFNADSSGPCQILVLPRRQLELQIEINDAQAYAAEPSGKKKTTKYESWLL